MSEERNLRTILREGLERVPPAESDLLGVARRARRLRVRRGAVAGLVALVAVAGITLPLLLLLPLGGTNPDHPRPASSASAWVEHDDAQDQVSIQTPPEWFFNDDPVPTLLDPRVLLAASTAPIQSGGECAPDNATGSLPSDGALFWVVEYTDVGTGTPGPQRAPYEFPPRDGSVQLGPLLGPFECIGVRTHLVLFRDSGRYFQVHVMLGPDAPASLESDVVRSLDSFAAAPTGGSSPSDLCASSIDNAWTFCPEAAWLYGAAVQAQFVSNGDTGTALVFAGRGAEFDLWSTHEQAVDASYRTVDTVDGVDVLSDGTRLTWLAQGVRVWVQAGPHADSQQPSGQSLTDLVRATFDVPLVNG